MRPTATSALPIPVGLTNMVAQVGGLAGSVLYGYIVDRSGSYDAPFVPMAVLLFTGAMLWLTVDASEKVGDIGAPLVPVLAMPAAGSAS